MPTATVPLSLALLPEQARALAQYLKRAGYSDYRALAASEDEAYAIQAAAEALRQALAEQGYAPR